MTIKIQYRRRIIECSTVEEFQGVMRALDEEEDRQRQQGNTALQCLAESLLTSGHHWDAEFFWKFVGNLGETQQSVLHLLVSRVRITDEELRTTLGLENNKQLAGVLSGISKQAAALGIPARVVYTIDKEFKSGEVTKTYVIAVDFLRIATEMNWEAE